MDLLGVWLKIHVFSLVAVATTEGQATGETENCWQSLDQRSACCNDEWTCWDAVFTKDGGGTVRWVGGPGRGKGTWRRLDAMTDRDVVNNHGDLFRPLRIGVWDLFQMAEIHG